MAALVDGATVLIDLLGKPALRAQDTMPVVAKDGGERAAGSPARRRQQRHVVDSAHGDGNASCELCTGATSPKIDGDDRHDDGHVGEGSRRCAEERKPRDDG